MPWTTVTNMEEINRFVMLARSGRFSMTDLCEQFGISRKTGYKHLGGGERRQVLILDKGVWLRLRRRRAMIGDLVRATTAGNNGVRLCSL